LRWRYVACGDSPWLIVVGREALTSIADSEECPQYNGLVLSEQLGLVPIGRDPESGLWEFWHVQTGAKPLRGEDGGLVLTEETGAG
jgi:hypothetical protein